MDNVVPDINTTVLGRRLRDARLQRGMRPEEVAYKAGCSLRTVTGLEAGEHHGQLATVARIVTVLQISLDWLLWGAEGSAPAPAPVRAPLPYHPPRLV